MKKAVKKVTKKEAAKPKGKAVAEKGKVAVAALKPSSDNESILVLSAIDYNKYKDILCKSIPENEMILLSPDLKFIVGELKSMFIRKYEKSILAILIIVIKEDELRTININPIKLFDKCLEGFSKADKKNLTSHCKLYFEDGEESIISITLPYKLTLQGTLGERIEKLTDYINSLLHDAATEMIAELTPSIKKK